MKNIINTLVSGLGLEGFSALLSRFFPRSEEFCCMHNDSCAKEAICCCEPCCC